MDESSKERVKYLDYMNDRLKKEANAKKTFTDINEAMNEYYDDDYDYDIQMDDFSNEMSPVNEGEEAETSFGSTGLSFTKTQFRNSVVEFCRINNSGTSLLEKTIINSSTKKINFIL